MSQEIYSTPKYPLFLDLMDREVVVVGAGKVAERKIATLLEYGANIMVIAPVATKAIEDWDKSGEILWVKRPYQENDLAGACMVICAVGIPSVNEDVFNEATANNTLINVVDVPRMCNFIVPSVVRRGPLQIAISTSGAAPTVAKQIRHDLEERYPDVWTDYMLLLGQIRSLVMANVPGSDMQRKPLFEAISNSDILERLRAGESLNARDMYNDIVIPLLASEAKGDTE
ncbi:MAG: bifunctional precorrin-2 dehydrogenase/sirohydrochlorin ferrochelatase [Actinobacteria bacterium]|nr:bifunctional precorrin-2 dehydrogenase/sirohydrochlorin ferrochelatase [Actinomycetota bacterium]